MKMEMKNWIKTVCFLFWTCVMCTACIDAVSYTHLTLPTT